jgi:hypothetical protein
MSTRESELKAALREVQQLALRAEIAKLDALYDSLHHAHHLEEVVLAHSAWLHRVIEVCDHALNKNVEGQNTV